MNMKKIFFAGVAMKLLFVVAAMILSGSNLFAQKTGYVKTETIFKNIQAYKNAITQVEKLAEEAQDQLDAEYEQIESLYNNYQRIRQ
jgi:outer membrane protein